ncbi:MAG: transporter substrate-binding domain-containing protein [Candidatus Methanospirareceae archaeon]
MSRILRYRHVFLITVMLGALLLTAGCISEDDRAPQDVTLTYYTEQLPPYNYEENGTLKGISVDLLESVTEELGVKVDRKEVHLVPWAEGYQTALTQPNTVLFSTARTPEREQSFKWAGPIYTDREVLFARRDRGITIQSPDDLTGYRIGVTGGDIAIQQLLELGVSQDQLVPESDVTQLIAQLESNEIDLWACPEISGRYFAEQVTGNYYAYAVVYHLQPEDVYYAFSKDVPDSTVQAFQQALDTVKEEHDAAGFSRYDRIIGRYIPAIGLAQLRYLTDELAPFNYQEDGMLTGISVEILEAVFRDIGVNRTRADVRVVPWTEGFEAARNETGTVLFSVVRIPEREQYFTWAGPFASTRSVLFAPITSNITIVTAADLNRYRIGTIQDSVENALLVGQGVKPSQLVPAKTLEELLRMLDVGEIDLWAMGELSGRHLMIMTAADPNLYEIVYTLSENDLYYVFSSDVPDTLVRAFQYSLDNVRNEKDTQGLSDYERIIYRYLGVGCTRQSFTDETVIALVDRTAAALEQNTPDTLRRINAGEAPYRDPTDPGLYVFVYDVTMAVVAHAYYPQQVGVNYRGKTDVTGKPFRDEIHAGALANGTGWVDYVYLHPVQPNLYYKTAYYRLTQGSDGAQYIVCSGNYKRCD